MANENCLKNMVCPRCGCEGPFQIEATATVTVHDDGTDIPKGNISWEDTSVCICSACDYTKTVRAFTRFISVMKQGLRDVLRTWPADDPQGIEAMRDLIGKCEDTNIEVIREEIFNMINIVENGMEQIHYDQLLTLLHKSLSID